MLRVLRVLRVLRATVADSYGLVLRAAAVPTVRMAARTLFVRRARERCDGR
jgi:hypothetical protein